MSDRAVPLLGDISLEHVQGIWHELDAGFVALPVPGLAGEVQQRAARGSHRVVIEGILHGDGTGDALGTLQKAAADGAELAFTADVTNALELGSVVIERFEAREAAGFPGMYAYRFELAESPPLPPPAEVSGGFGGLGDFGLGDLGIDAGVLDDIAGAAGEIAAIADQAMAAVDALQGLAALGNLGSGAGVLGPLTSQSQGIGGIASGLTAAATAARSVFG